MNNKGQLSIIAALLVAVILITSVAVTYSIIRNSPIQDQPPIQNAIDETNFAIRQIAGFTVGYYGSVLQVTGNSTYANMSAINYFQSGLMNIVNMHPEWATSLELDGSHLGTYWFSNMSYSSGSFAVNYNLTGLGISGISYTTSCKLSTSILNTTGTRAVLNVTQDDSEPLVNLGKQNFRFYSYDIANSSWDLISPVNEPTAYGNGTYQIDIPSGVDPYSYVVQIEDRRGIIVVASSFNSYSCALTWGNVSANGIINQALYAHSETTNIAGTPYYLQELPNADRTGSSLQASTATVGRQLWGSFVFPLTGVSSIPASTWTVNYRAWRDNAPSITFDGSSSANNGGGATSITWSHTTGTGSNRIMVVGVSIRTATVSVSQITYGIQSLMKIRSDTHSGGNIRSELWYLIAPNSGTATVTVTLSGSSRAVGGSCSYAGVDQTSPIDAQNGATGTSNSPSQTIIVNTASSMLVGHVAAYSSSSPATVTEGTGQTFRWDDTTSRNRGHGSQKGPIIAGSQSMSWTLSSSNDWAVSLIALKPAVSSPSVHADVDILIRRSTGAIRTAIATNVASSADLTSTATTLTGTYSWAAYAVVNQTDYLEIDYYADVSTATPSLYAYLRIDDSSLATTDQTRTANIILPSQNGISTVVELLQNGTMRWLGQGLSLAPQAKPIPPIPVKSFHVNETVNGVGSEAPFQMEDWASEYRIPLGLTNNASIFNSDTMLVFMVNPNVSSITLWWNGSDTAAQTSVAYTNKYFNDNPSSNLLTNSAMTLQFDTSSGNFKAVSTVGTSSCTATFMRINTDQSTYGAGPSYVITNGTIRDIVHQEAEWSSGVPNCPDIYSDIVLTLPANTPYYTYQLRLMFVESQWPRNITELCPISISGLSGQMQTENGTAGGYPVVSNNTGVFYNYSPSTWAHHWSQAVSGAQGAGIMLTDSALQELYLFDSIAGNKTGGLKASSATGPIECLPVTLAQVNINPPFDSRATDIIWYGAVATFDGTTPIYDNYDQTGLWTLVEYPPSITVTSGS